jgi:CRISPR-associated protein Csx10
LEIPGVEWAEMKQIQLTINALSGLAIGLQKPGGSVSEADDFIPGTVIRGAIAAHILQQSGQQSTDLADNGGDFQSLFLSDAPAIFLNAYPSSIQGKKQVVIQPKVSIIPSTALSSKTNPGFKTSNPKCNGVFDTLIDRFCAESYGCPYDPNCPSDYGRVDAFTGFYSILNNKYYKHEVSKRLLTRVGINRRRATAEENILYSIEVLNESQGKQHQPVSYSSAILIDDTSDAELAENLYQFIKERCQDFRLGGSTSRGLGKVEITAHSPQDTQSETEERIRQFNAALKKRWEAWRIFGSPLEDVILNRTFFTLGLQAEAILSENWQRTMVISEAMLRQFAGVEDDSLNLQVSYSSYSYRSGWNAAWGLMKDVELVTNRGAVFLFSTNQPDLWIRPLAELEWRGVGDRTCEGFGQVRVCDGFHLVFREEKK